MKGAVGGAVATGSISSAAAAQRKKNSLLQEVDALGTVEPAARLESKAFMAAMQDMNKSSALCEGQLMNAL